MRRAGMSTKSQRVRLEILTTAPSELPEQDGLRNPPIFPFVERRLFPAPNPYVARSKVAANQLLSDSPASRSRSLDYGVGYLVARAGAFHVKMAATTRAGCNIYTAPRVLQRCADGVWYLSRIYPSDELTVAVPPKGRFEVLEHCHYSRASDDWFVPERRK